MSNDVTSPDFTPFASAEQFYRWAETNGGREVKTKCQDEIGALLQLGVSAQAVEIYNRLTKPYRRVDCSRSGMKARPVY